MEEYEIKVPARLKDGEIVQRIEAALPNLGYHITLSSTLKKYPGCRHWHLHQQGLQGTLDLTWWPARRRLWLSSRSRRTTASLADQIPILLQQLETHLGSTREEHLQE
jgi:hypothetical protein